MLQIKIESHYSQEPKVFSINGWGDFVQIYRLYPRTKSIVANSGTLSSAAKNIAKYLSNHAETATVLDPDDLDGMDEEIISQDDFDNVEFPESPQSLDDIRAALESKKDQEVVDIPPNIVAQDAAHWDRPEDEFVKNEELQKDRGRITFPADPKITNRPDQEVKPTSLTTETYAGKRLKDPQYAKKLFDPNSTITGSHYNDDIPFTISADRDPSATEHEGLHHLSTLIERRHGHQNANNFIDSIAKVVDPNVHRFLHNSLVTNAGYRNLLQSHPRKFQEEKLALLRDLLVPGPRRQQMIAMTDPQNFQHTDQKLKSSWQKAMQAAKDFKLPEPVSKEENEKFPSFSNTYGKLEKSNKVVLVNVPPSPEDFSESLEELQLTRLINVPLDFIVDFPKKDKS